MRVRSATLLTVLVFGCVSAPAAAQAQWVATPYLGANILGDVETVKGGPGGSVGYFGGRLGFELDLTRYHHFFRDEDVSSLIPDSRIDLDTDAWSFMGNVVVPMRSSAGRNWRPYGTAGVGVIRAMFNFAQGGIRLSDVTGPLEIPVNTGQNNLGFNAGGGLMYSLTERVGLRGDLRYLRALVDEDKREGGFFKDYDFWRVTFGVTFRF